MAETTADKPQVTLYWLDQSRSQRFIWLLEECKGMDYNIEVYKRGKDMLAPKELKKIHPLGKSPIVGIKAPARPEPLILAESGAIMEYLCDYFAPHLVPKRYQEGKEGQVGGETEQWLRYRFYMHYAEGSLMTLMLIAFMMNQIKDAPVPFFIKPIVRAIPNRIETMFLNENFKTHFGFLEGQLNSSPDGGQYICGKELTAADIMLSFPLIAGKSRVDMSAYPKVGEYVKMLEQHEGYKNAVKKAEEATGEPLKANL